MQAEKGSKPRVRQARAGPLGVGVGVEGGQAGKEGRQDRRSEGQGQPGAARTTIQNQTYALTFY